MFCHQFSDGVHNTRESRVIRVLGGKLRDAQGRLDSAFYPRHPPLGFAGRATTEQIGLTISWNKDKLKFVGSQRGGHVIGRQIPDIGFVPADQAAKTVLN